MSDLPVFQTVGELRLWRRLRGEGQRRLGGDRDTPAAMAHEVLALEGTVHPAILVEAVRKVSGEDSSEDLLGALVSKSRPADAGPSVAAAEAALEKGETSLAAEMLAMSARSQEVRGRGLALAETYLMEGDMPNAADAARKVYGADPGCRRAYGILAEADPEGGWGQRCNIQSVLEGGKPEYPPGTGRMQELYSIYYDWFRGSREAATRRLVGSRYYSEKDPEFLLASARFSVDERDWRSACMVFDGIVGGSPAFVALEAAEACLEGGEPGRALKLLADADRTLPRVRRDLIRANMDAGDRREALVCIRAHLDSEGTDVDEYLSYVGMLMDAGMDSDAAALLDRVSATYSRDPSFLTFSSMVSLRRGDIPAAARAAKEAVRRGGDDPGARLQRARMYLVAGNTDRAERECSRLLADDPDSIGALVLRRDIAVARGDHRAAADACRDLIDRDPSDSESLITAAVALHELGDADGVSEALEACLAADQSPEGRMRTLETMLSCGLFREALTECREMEREHGSPELGMLKGNAEYGLGEYLKASLSYASVVKERPEDAVAWHSKGMADEARGDLQSAREAYTKAVALDLDSTEYWTSLSCVQAASGDRESAVKSLDRVLSLDPSDLFALVSEAWILSDMSEHGRAADLMERALAVSPDDADVRRDRVRVLMAAGRYGDAIEAAASLVSEGDQRAVAAVSECYLELGRREDAAKLLKEGLAGDPGSEVLREADGRMKGTIKDEPPAKAPVEPDESPDELAEMAVSLLEAGDRRGAMRAIDRALSAEPDNPGFMLVKARTVLAGGDRAAAVVMVTSAIRTNPNIPELHVMLGDLRMLSGDHRGAVQEYETAMAQGDSSSGTYAKLGEASERTGDRAGAEQCYAVLMERGDAGPEIAGKMVRLMLSRGDAETARRYVDGMLESDPDDADAWVLRGEYCMAAGDPDGVLDAYDGFSACPSRGADGTVRMVKLLEDSGHPDKASELAGGRSEPEDVDRAVKRYAEKAMRRAYTSRTPLDDPDLMSALGFDDDIAAKVSSYLGSLPDYGRITPGTDAFRAMERRSHDIVMKLGWKDLEKDSRIPLEKVFVGGSCRDADEARELAGYIYKAMHCDVGRKADGRLTAMSMRLPRGMSVYDVMKECDVGIYEARQVLAQVV